MKSLANQQKNRGTTFFTSAVLLTLLCLNRPALSQVAILGDWETGTSHTKESGTDRALVFVAHGEMDGTMNLTAVTYGGQSMTKVVERNYTATIEAYVVAYILGEGGVASATGETFVPIWDTTPAEIKYASVFLSDVNQSNLTGDSATAGGTSATISTSSLTTNNGDIVIDAATCGNTGTYTLNNGFIQGTHESSISSTGVTGYKFANGVNETPSVTHTYVNRQALIGFVVQAAQLDPNKATNPNPGSGAGHVSVSTSLSWDAPTAYTPSSYDVYFGTNPTAHTNPKNTVDTNSYDPPGDLAESTPYYWAVDCNDNGTIYTGNPWNFTTEGSYCGDGTCDDDEDCWTCEADCGVCGDPTWRVDARCLLDGPPGSFDDISVKDPSIVYYGGKWHLFYTGRDSSMWRTGYASATSISGLQNSSRTLLSSIGGSYFCAPQVFWFEAKGKWFLIYQTGVASFSTNTDIGNPGGWTSKISMGFNGGVDYWCISDGNNVYCFYSPLDDSRTIKRRSTTVADFPYNWSSASTVATDTFEAPHVYKNIADGQYYMMVEDIARHFELWTASNPGGTWTKLQEYWAHKSQLIYNADHWTDQVSHGEIIRAGVDEKMEISDINRCEILFQGVVDGDYGAYENIPYDLGMIRQCPAGPADLDLDCDIDFMDFEVLAGQWQQPPSEPSADIAPPGGDGIVNMNDLDLLLESWLWGK